MNARATLSNGRTVKENGGGKVVVQDHSEVALEVLKMCSKYKDTDFQRNLEHD
jgi:hypothetical protein